MISQDQLPMLAIAEMNDNHLEEMLLVQNLDKVARENDIPAVTRVLKDYLEHSIQHFKDEEKLMEEAVAFAKTFNKKRGIFGEHKKRLHKNIVKVMESEDPPIIESLALFIEG